MLLLLASALPILFELAPPALGPTATSGPVLRLEEATQTALKRQPAVLQAKASTEAAAERADQARSGFLPQITGTALYQHGYGTPVAATAGTTPVTTMAGTSGAGTYDRFSFGANATQLLWDFGQTYQRYRAASRSVEAVRISEKTIDILVLVNVRRAFFQARAQKALVKVAEETLSNQQKHMDQIQGFVSVGTRPEIDLAQAKTDLANDRLLLINSENSYAIAKAVLNQSMGSPRGTSYDVAEDELPPIEGEDANTDRLVDVAIVQRPELASLERQHEAQELTVKSIKGAYGPTISAFGGASEVGPSIDNLGPNWNVGAQLAWPIFQGGLTTGLVREAEANLDVTRAQLESERLQVRLDVEQGLLTVRGAKAAIGAAEDALTNARDRLRLAEGRYQSGVGSIIELGDAQIALTNAASQKVQAQYNLSTARAQLLAALGRR